MNTKIYPLTSNQQSLLPQYLKKWKSIALSKQRIDQQQATAAVRTLYAAIDQSTPEIVFCESPAAVAKVFIKLLKQQLPEEMQWLVGYYSNDEKSKLLDDVLGWSFQGHFNRLQRQLNQQLEEQLQWEVHIELEEKLRQPLDRLSYDWQLWEQLESNRWLWQQLRDCISSGSLITDACWMDFAIDTFNCTPDLLKWQAFKSLVEHCGWILLYEKVCIVCDRPIFVAFDRQTRLHAEGKPALQYADGFRVYAYQNIRLPEKYGKFHPHQWRSIWLLDEANAELRRILLQGIGYGRICQELDAIVLDSWREYTLLEIDADLDDEPIRLLKMTCPSTGLIHVSRVPPHVASAREAIQWVNWDIDPEEFAFQT